MRHTIEAIAFIRGTNDGDTTCSCGWTGLASDYNFHRKSEGLPTDLTHGLGPRTVTPRAWNNTIRTDLPTCVHGHTLVEGNIYVTPTTGQRSCLTCRRERAAVQNDRRKAERAAA